MSLLHTNRIKPDSECSSDFPTPTSTNAKVLKDVEFPAEGLRFAEKREDSKENVNFFPSKFECLKTK